MTLYSPNLRLALQETNENPNSWGDVANAGVFQLLEDAVSGLETINVAVGDVTLTTANGASDQARAMMLILTGAPGASRNVFVPAVSKLYLVRNDTTGGQTITVLVSGQTGVQIPAGNSIWVYCDGTDVVGVDVDNANTANTATNATNATQLGGIGASQYARLDRGGTDQSFTRSQNTARVPLTAGTTVSVDANASNSFYLQPTSNFTLANPTGAPDGTTIRILIEQPAGANYVITWGSAYKFAGGVQPALTPTNGAIDYFSFEKVTGNVWVGGGLLDLR